MPGRTVRLLLLLAGLVLAACGVLAGRLAHGPLEVTWLVRRLLSHTAGLDVDFRRASLSWAVAVDGAPLVLRLQQVTLSTDHTVVASASDIAAGIAPGAILLGRIRLLSIVAEHGTLGLVRTTDGILLPGRLLSGREATGAAGRQHTLLPGRVQLADILVTITDRGSGKQARVKVARLSASRLATSRPLGDASLDLIQPGAATARTALRLAGSDQTGTLANLLPGRLTPLLAGVTAPFSAGVHVSFGADLRPRSAELNLSAGSGSVDGVGILGAAARLSLADMHHLAVQSMLVHLATGSTLSARGTAEGDGTAGSVTGELGIDRADLATLARAWPAGVARDARAWITANIPRGTAHDGAFAATARWSPGGVTLTSLQGQLAAEHLTVHWLRPVPPLVDADATVHLLGPDALLILVARASQSPSDPGAPPLAVGAATVRITGLTQAAQTLAIDAPVTGPVAQYLALLREPRLHLLAAHPMNFGNASGSASTRLRLSLPLDARVTQEQIAVAVGGTLERLHLGSVIGGKDLDGGMLAVSVTGAGLTMDGTVSLAGLPSHLSVGMDFRTGSPDQTTASYSASGSADMAALRRAGIPLPGGAQGRVAYAAAVQEHRDGTGAAQVHVDFGQAGLSLHALGWSKQPAQDAAADARIRLDHDRLVGVDLLSVNAPDVTVQAHAAYDAGRPVALTFERLRLGRTEATGTLRFPTPADSAVHADFSGPVLDLSALAKAERQQADTASHRQSRPAAASRRGTPWKAALRFAAVLTGPHSRLTALTASVADDGRVVRRAVIAGQAGHTPFRFSILPSAGGRALHGTAADAGSFLQSLGVTASLAGGTLALDGAYDDARPDHPLSGTATIDRFRVTNAPSVARLLQGMTLYGLVDVLKGPGLGITHLVLPFRLADRTLGIQDARAFSGSLGFTAAGDIDLAASRADLTGTIVPAYFFNTLLGRLPVFGKLFSAEKGGGLFAATYTLTGSLADPAVHINPLAALAPGALRGLFKLPSAAQGGDAGVP